MKVLLREALTVAVLSGLTFQALRAFVADRYVVPSGSMQPVLYGAEVGGDVVLVDKTARVDRLQRFDLAVFRRAQNGEDLVKRVASLGDEWVEVRDGDLFAGPAADRLERVQKHPLDCRDLRVPWLVWPWPLGQRTDALLPAGEAAAGRLLVPTFATEADARSSCRTDVRVARAELDRDGRAGVREWLQTRAVDGCYVDAHGQRRTEGSDLRVDDFGADFEIELRGVRALLLGLDLRPDSWVLRWEPATGAIELWRNGETVERRLDARAALRPDGATRVRVEYGRLDGAFFVAVGGDPQSLWWVAQRRDWMAIDEGPVRLQLPQSGLRVAAVGGAGCAVDRLTVFRDLHWFRPPLEVGAVAAQAARHVPPGMVWLLGDNSVDSRDSRMFGALPWSAFVGRPRAVLGPWPFQRWLSR